MKIFISYGHNDHVKLVDLLFDTLIEAGYEPWKDDRYEGFSGIPAGKDFTDVIYKAIDESDFVVAFVTAATVNKRYCRDERMYAYTRKESRYIQIRLDEAPIYLGNSDSYIDMSDVEDHTGEVNKQIFDRKIQALFAALKDPESFSVGGLSYWAKFEAHLKIPGMLRYLEFVTLPSEDDFVGREWLREKCVRWAQDSTIPCRLFVMLGEAGTGKTAFIRHLSADNELVRSVHVCVFDKPSTRNVKDTLKNLAYTLAQNNFSYYDFLKNKNFEKIGEMTTDALFEFLFLEPLKNEKSKYLIIIDGLDELDELTGLDPLMQLFRQYATRINPNISFLVTGRPDANIRRHLRTIGTGKPVEEVLLDKEMSRDDLIRYIEKKLAQLNIYTKTLADKILDSCDGNFEYLSLLFKEVHEGLELSENIPLPRGLYSRYTQYLQRRMKKFTRLQRTVLSLLCVAYEPLGVSFLENITREDEDDILDEMKEFGSLIRRKRGNDGEEYLSLFTKGFRDFLLAKADDEYYADAKKGTKLFGEFVLENCPDEASLKHIPYIDRNGLTHLMMYAVREKDRACRYIDNLKEANTDATAARVGRALCSGEDEIFDIYCYIKNNSAIKGAPITYLKRYREIDTLTEIVNAYTRNGMYVEGLVLKGDILRMNPTQGKYAEAEKLYLEAMELRLKEDQSSPSFDSRENLCIIYDRLGLVAENKSTPEGLAQAKEWYLKCLELDEINFSENPCYTSRRGIVVTYRRLCDIATYSYTKEALEQAEKWCLTALELAKDNYKENPCYTSRSDLALVYDRLGDIERHRSTPESLERAEQWYRMELELDELNYNESPSYQSRRSVGITCDKLGSLARKKSTPEGLAQAEQFYLRGLSLDEQNYSESPCFQSRRDLSITCERLGKIAEAKGTDEGMAEAEKWYRQELELDEISYAENPCYKSRRGLAITCEILADLLELKGTPEAKKEAIELFERDLELSEINYRDNPCYESRRSLAIIYERMGDLARKKKKIGSMREAVQWYEKYLELTEQNYKENPCYESRSSLSISYERLGITAELLGELDKAEMWYTRELEVVTEIYNINPNYENRRSLSISYGNLFDVEKSRGTRESLLRAKKWILQKIELEELNYKANPCKKSKEYLEFAQEKYKLVIKMLSDTKDTDKLRIIISENRS